MDKSSFGYKVTVNHTEHETVTEEYINGKKRNQPLYIGSDNPYSAAQACRAAAYYLLERADIIQHSKDFIHVTTKESMQEQIKLMLSELEINL